MLGWRVAAVVGSLVFGVVGAQGQNEKFPIPKSPLPEQSEAILRRLNTLRELPGVAWEWHVGDLPHGEDPAANDGKWVPLKRGDTVGPEEAVWVRARFTVPKLSQGYDLTGAGLVMDFHFSPNGTVPEIVYLNGRRIALGTDLEPEVLESKLAGGENIAVAVKLLGTAEPKTLREPTLLVRFAAGRPEPTRLREEAESAAILLPTLDRDAKVLTADLGVLESALNGVDLQALERGEQGKFDASLVKAEGTLEPLRAKLATLSVAAVGNSHVDAAWKWTATETMEVVKNTFTSATQLMSEYPNFKYTQPDMQYYAWMESKYPALFAEMQRKAKTGQWNVVGGMWAEPDLNEPDGETMVRELLLGKRYAQQKFGVDVKVGWNVDSFGYSWQLPQIYKKSGVDFFVTQKINWNEQNRLPLNLFWWQSPDGSAVLTYFPMSYNGTTDPLEMARELTNARGWAPGLRETMHVYGVGDHGGGPTRVQLDGAEKWMAEKPVYPKLTMSTPEQFFADVAPKVSALGASPLWNYKTFAAGEKTLPAPAGDGISVPVWRDELYLETHRGTYTSQAKQKKNMRDSEEWMLDAEKMSSVAWAMGGGGYPGVEFNEAWKKLLFNTNHDLAAGSGIAEIYRDAQVDYDAIHATAADAMRRATEWMVSEADTRPADVAKDASVVVLNTLAWPRDGLVTVSVQLPAARARDGISVTDALGKRLPVQVLSRNAAGVFTLLIKAEAVPAVGYEVLQVRAGASEVREELHVSKAGLENDVLSVVVDPVTGCVTHLVDKRTGFDSIADGGCGNQLQTFADNPKKYDAWNIDPEALGSMVPVSAVDSVEVLDQGPLRASLRITRHWGKSTFAQTLVMYAGVDRVDVENKFDWHETHTLLKVAFPLRASSDKAAFEIPYGVIERPTTRNNAVGRAQYEVPALRWADLGDGAHGLSVLNNSKYGYDATAHLLRLTLLRSPLYPDPEADRGTQEFVYSLYPHAGSWKDAMTERRGYEFNYALTAWQAPVHEGALGRAHSFAELQGDGVILTAMKKSEDGHALILRAFDWSGKGSRATLRLPAGAVSATEADMLEHATSVVLPLKDGAVTLPMNPYEIKTIRVEYGAER